MGGKIFKKIYLYYEIRILQYILCIVFHVISGVLVPFKLPNPDACVDSGLNCPLQKGTTYKYEASFPVLNKYPKLDVEVKYELKPPSKTDIVCVLIPVKIV